MGSFLGVVDTDLQAALDAVTAYFSANIGAVIAAFVGIAVLLWLLSKFLGAVGIKGRVK